MNIQYGRHNREIEYLNRGDIGPVAEFNEFERRFKFKPRLKYGWFYLKCFKIQAGAKFKPGFGGFWRI